MVKNKSVLLIYSNDNRIKFQKYAELFRLVGIYVCEGAKEDCSGINNFEDYDVRYDLDEEKYDGSQKDLNERLMEVLEVNLSNFNQLVATFIKYNVLQASMTLQYFCIDTPVVKEAGILFSGAATELSQYYEQNKKISCFDYSIRYAILYCKQKANLAQYLTKDYLYYTVDGLLEEALQLQHDFPECSNTWMLMGLVCEISKVHKLDAVEAFKRARDAVGNKPYVSSILYRLGKNCEEIESLRELMDDSYQTAYEVLPKYRNIYKVAKKYMLMDMWDLAARYFKKCIDKILLRGSGQNGTHYLSNLKHLDPLEQEYFFKVNSHLAYISINRMEYEEAIRYAEIALDFRDAVYADRDLLVDYDRMYSEVYGGGVIRPNEMSQQLWKPESFVRLEITRMGAKNLYKYLAIANDRLGRDDLAESYWSVVKKML